MSKFREWTLIGAYVRHLVGNTDSEVMHSAIATLPQIPVGEEIKVIEYAALEAERARNKKLAEALEFYAQDVQPMDYGNRAKQALKSYNEGEG